MTFLVRLWLRCSARAHLRVPFELRKRSDRCSRFSRLVFEICQANREHRRRPQEIANVDRGKSPTTVANRRHRRHRRRRRIDAIFTGESPTSTPSSLAVNRRHHHRRRIDAVVADSGSTPSSPANRRYQRRWLL